METAAFFAKAPPPQAPGAAIVAASGGAAIMAADRAEQHGVPMPQPVPEVRAVLESRIPEFGSSRNPCDVTAQVLSDPESLGACAGALLSDPQYGVLVSPLTYGYAPSAKRPLVYSDLAKQHGKMACVVWQTEWQDGPGVVEANQCDRVALFRSMNACFARAGCLALAGGQAGGRGPERRGDAGRGDRPGAGADRGGQRADADGTRGEGDAGALRRAGGWGAAGSHRPTRR